MYMRAHCVHIFMRYMYIHRFAIAAHIIVNTTHDFNPPVRCVIINEKNTQKLLLLHCTMSHNLHPVLMFYS